MTESTNESLTTEVADDGTIVVHGDIDMAGGPVLEAALLPHEDGPVVLDLTDVSFIDSSGLRSLLEAGRRARARGDEVVLRAARPEVLRLLEITGTAGQFTVESHHD